MNADHLRELARDCELQAARLEEHFDWRSLPPEVANAIQREVFNGLAFVLNEVADVLDAEERAAA